MKLVFDHRMFRHINESAVKERGKASGAMLLAERLLQRRLVALPLALAEHVAGFVLALPVPVYASLIYAWITQSRGLPHFSGMYLRALYYRRRLGRMEPNVFIDQGVFFAFPRTVELSEFCFIDKGVMLMSRSAKVGRRVHIAPRVFVSGGGDFVIEDYACIATNSNIITSTEVLKDGARCSGPMASAAQRTVLRSRVLIRKDAFVGANATLLPGVTVGEGSVIGASATVARDTAPWSINVGAKTQVVGQRDPVRFEDD